MQKYTSIFTDLKYLLGYKVPVGTFFAICAGGWYSYVVPFYAFVLIPLMEMMLPADVSNLSPEQEHSKLKNKFFDWLLYLNVPLQFFLLFYFCHMISDPGRELWEKIGMTASMGIACGVLGINVAHELGHRQSRTEQGLAQLLLLTSLYMHFFIEHNRGHHRNVGTGEDPASARYGESLYRFYFRTVPGSFRSAWRLEKLRLQRGGKRVWSGHNQMLRFIVYQALFTAFIFAVSGPAGGLGFMCAALGGILLLETVNYVEHYGLRRKLIEPGLYEKVKPEHSWNSDHLMGRIMLYELTRHSDHHYKATRKFQVLRHFEQSPQLPLGYPGSMVLACFPPLWFAVMHRRIRGMRPV